MVWDGSEKLQSGLCWEDQKQDQKHQVSIQTFCWEDQKHLTHVSSQTSSTVSGSACAQWGEQVSTGVNRCEQDHGFPSTILVFPFFSSLLLVFLNPLYFFEMLVKQQRCCLIANVYISTSAPACRAETVKPKRCLIKTFYLICAKKKISLSFLISCWVVMESHTCCLCRVSGSGAATWLVRFCLLFFLLNLEFESLQQPANDVCGI